MKLFSIKDTKACKYLNIFMADNMLTALREIQGVVNEKGAKTLFAKYPEDFQLFCIGDLDQDTGVITPKVEFIENFIALVKSEHEVEND